MKFPLPISMKKISMDATKMIQFGLLTSGGNVIVALMIFLFPNDVGGGEVVVARRLNGCKM